MKSINRREFIKYTGAGAAGLALPFSPEAGIREEEEKAIAIPKNPICIFSKHLQFLDFEDLGKYVIDVGFDGVDLTVRKGGHVEPAEAPDVLPSALEKIRKSGALVPMMASSINDPDDPLTEPVLKAAGENGVEFYRMAYHRYDPSRGTEEKLSTLRPAMTKLADINEKYGIHGAYQNHQGEFVGASIWDWWYVIKDLDPRWIGFQYDVRHAIVEGGMSWVNDFSLIKDFVRCSVIKDFHWVKKKDGSWRSQSVPLNEGMVNFERYFGMYKQFGINGPISLHFEYPIYEKSMTKKEKMDFALKVMAKDIEKLRGHLQNAGL